MYLLNLQYEKSCISYHTDSTASANLTLDCLSVITWIHGNRHQTTQSYQIACFRVFSHDAVILRPQGMYSRAGLPVGLVQFLLRSCSMCRGQLLLPLNMFLRYNVPKGTAATEINSIMVLASQQQRQHTTPRHGFLKRAPLRWEPTNEFISEWGPSYFLFSNPPCGKDAHILNDRGNDACGPRQHQRPRPLLIRPQQR